MFRRIKRLDSKINLMPFTLPEPSQKSEYVGALFSRIAPFYDRMNRIMTFGQDIRWRKRVIDLLEPQNWKVYLDAGAGTGDLAQMIVTATQSSIVVAVDLTREMINLGKKNHIDNRILWVQADTLSLPFKSDVFDGVVSGYVLRNVVNINQAIGEQVRVTTAGTKVISLDTTPPENNLLYPFIQIYLRWIMPLLGKLVTGDAQAYRYLSVSSDRHLPSKELDERMRLSGLTDVTHEKWMAGTMAIHSGRKNNQST